MQNVIELQIRPSDVILDRVLNPARSETLDNVPPAHMLEACGIIPDFFAAALIGHDARTLDSIADAMDKEYSFGGFSYAWQGTVEPDGTYTSPDDDPLPPLCRFGFEGRFFCYVYQYGITALVDTETGEQKIGRFD